ncbi:BnaA05g15510D [Brassica napus]|uniref:BnaA05g15510D protein n=1 Tax=Brassica napus TaxID=3708 RepID=A0A078GWV2_BRANA|nr:BnaA05g15510D [Brassica napus]
MASRPPFETHFSSIFGSSFPRSTSDEPTVQTSGIKLPVIDLSHLTNGEEVTRKRCVKQMVEAAKEWGFFQVVNHGIPKEVFEMMFREDKKFFDRSFNEKVREKFSDSSKHCYRWGNPNATSPTQYSFSEAFHITLAEILSFSDEGNNFRRTVAMYVQEVARVAHMICEILGNQVKVNSKYFENIFALQNSFLRLNKYHPCVFGSQVFGLVPHTDTSFITILAQDQIGGLELKKNGQWIGVKPCSDALTVNIGDMFQALSNGVYQSVRHRVIPPANVERLSIAFFICPYQETEIEFSGNPKKYRRFSFREYKEQSERDVKETGLSTNFNVVEWSLTSSKAYASKLFLKIPKGDTSMVAAATVDPCFAVSLASRFPANIVVKSEVRQLVQAHIVDLRTIPEALPYFVTPETVEENSALLQQLPHLAACSITQALGLLTPAYKGHPRVMAYVLRVLESYPRERVTFFMPQLVQSLRYDKGGESVQEDGASVKITKEIKNRRYKNDEIEKLLRRTQIPRGKVTKLLLFRLSQANDALFLRCGRLSHSNSAAAAKTKRYSVSKRSFDFDKNGNADKADAEKGGEEEEAERQIHQRRRRVASGAEETDSEQRRERKRRTPSSEREDSKSYRSGSRERGSGSRRVSRSPERRSETTNPNNGIGSSVNSSNNNNIPAKFVSVPATDKEKRSSNNNADASIKRVAVKRNVASPRCSSHQHERIGMTATRVYVSYLLKVYFNKHI